MEGGLRVHLDPHGGNVVNVRQLLVNKGLLRPRGADALPDAHTADERENGVDSATGDPDAGVANPQNTRGLASVIDKYSQPQHAAPPSTPSKRGLTHPNDAYDVEDDFIDDTDLFDYEDEIEDDNHAEEEGEEESQVVALDSDIGEPQARVADETAGDSEPTPGQSKNMSVRRLEPVYAGFYICRGEIPLQTTQKRKRDAKAAVQSNSPSSKKQKHQRDIEPLQAAPPRESASAHKHASKNVPESQKNVYDRTDGVPLRDPEPSARDNGESKRANSDTHVREPELGQAEKLDASIATATQKTISSHVATGKDIDPQPRPPVVGSDSGAAVASQGGEPQCKPPPASQRPPQQPTVKKRRSLDSTTGALGLTRLPPQVVERVETLKDLCAKVYADKKPRVNENVEVQEVLQHLLCSAREKNCAKLMPDKRSVSVSDALWSTLGFLRTTRANLGTLGYALHWAEEEKVARERVGSAETEMRNLLGSSAGSEDTPEHNRALKPVPWDIPLEQCLHKWWKCRCQLLEASNQLGDPSRQKSVKKAQPSWVASLAKSVFSEFKLTEDELAGKVRAVEEEKAREARLRREECRRQREAEKLERKAKKQRETDAKKASDVRPSLKGGVLMQLKKMASLKPKQAASANAAAGERSTKAPVRRQGDQAQAPTTGAKPRVEGTHTPGAQAALPVRDPNVGAPVGEPQATAGVPGEKPSAISGLLNPTKANDSVGKPVRPTHQAPPDGGASDETHQSGRGNPPAGQRSAPTDTRFEVIEIE